MNITETIISFFVASAAIATPVIVSQAPIKPSVNTLQPTPKAEIIKPTVAPEIKAPTVAPERIKIKVNLFALEDLKVRQGDSISKGQIIADRANERARLITAKREFEATLKQLLSTVIPKPPEPKPVPAIAPLPPVSYLEEEAQIAAEELRKMQSERDYKYWEKILSSEPVAEVAAVEKARVERDKKLKEIQNQETKIELVEQLQNLPKAVLEHESEVLTRLKSELDQAEYALRLEQGKLVNSGDRNKEKLQQLAIKVESSKADLLLAKTRLQSAKEKRQELEYEHSITIARRTEEENQAKQIYSRQIQDYEQDLRSRDFQVSQLREKINNLNNQLAQLSNVRSPINGVVRRIKTIGQSDNVINLELTVISGSTGTVADPFTGTPGITGTPSAGESTTPGTGTTSKPTTPGTGTGTTSNWDD